MAVVPGSRPGFCLAFRDPAPLIAAISGTAERLRAARNEVITEIDTRHRDPELWRSTGA